LSKRLIAVLGGALAIALIAAGCGSSSDESSTSSLTKAQFIAKADAICTKGNKEIETESEAYAEENGIDLEKEPADAQKEELVTEVIAPGVLKQGEEIGAIGAPSGEEGQVNEIVEAVETAAAETEEDPSAVINGSSGPFTKANKLAKDYGLKVCGEE